MMFFRRSGRSLLLSAVLAAGALCLSGCGGKRANAGGDKTEGPDSYSFVSIGGKMWMTRNLNEITADSWCYGEGGREFVWSDSDPPKYRDLSVAEIQAHCSKYGRLYTWSAAKAACRSKGWRLPTSKEWDDLAAAAGGSSAAGKKLKSTDGWKENGTDSYGFAALPGGIRISSDGDFANAGISGDWWTATDDDSSGAYGRAIFGDNDDVIVYYDYNNKSSGLSVRCLQEAPDTPSAISDTPSISYDTLSVIDDTIFIEMVRVEGGTFTMGCTSEQEGDCYEFEEKPTHSVTLSSYYIGKYEVTQGLWKAVMGSDNNPSAFKGDSLPVESVSWNDIVNDFIPKLNALTGKTYRLPTEAEWEYAARGGNKSGGYKYSGSHNINRVAWYGYYNGTSGGTTHPVGTKSPNELGIYDMSGNVWESVNDWYGDYSSSAQTNPKGPDGGSERAYRGGSWGSDARRCRVSSHDAGSAPDAGDRTLGFRLASTSP